jgi:hypothetical protein
MEIGNVSKTHKKCKAKLYKNLTCCIRKALYFRKIKTKA